MQSPSQAAQKWARNLGASTQAIQEGVNSVTVSPTERAAARQDAYLAGVNRSVADGKYAAGLRRVSLEDWKRAMLSKGLNRIASGAAAAQPKVEAFLAEFLPYVEAGVRSLPARGDVEQNKQRVLAMIDHNHRFRRRG